MKISAHGRLGSQVSLYAVINRERGYRFPRLSALAPGTRVWLDGIRWLERHEDCGCARLGRGGRTCCSSEHLEDWLAEGHDEGKREQQSP